jgi:hypothetical protein
VPFGGDELWAEDQPPPGAPRGASVVHPDAPTGWLPLREVALQVGRSLSTLRAWVRSGRLQSYREPGDSGRTLADPRAAALVAAELDPKGAHGAPRPEPTDPRGASPRAPDHADLEGLREALAAWKATAEAHRETIVNLREALAATGEAREAIARAEARQAETLRETLRDTREDLERTRAELVGVRAELAALRHTQGIPFWQRLLGK